MPMGPSVDGKGWVNINNKCKCGHGMPLPESHGKHCSECGTRQHTWEEFPQYPGVRKPNVGPSADGDNKCKCGHGMPLPESYGKYCSECGTRQPTREESPQYPGVRKPNVSLVVSDVVKEDLITEFVPPLGQPYQLPDTRHRIGEWFYRTRHHTWVLSVTEDNLSEKMPMWVLDSTHVPEE